MEVWAHQNREKEYGKVLHIKQTDYEGRMISSKQKYRGSIRSEEVGLTRDLSGTAVAYDGIRPPPRRPGMRAEARRG